MGFESCKTISHYRAGGGQAAWHLRKSSVVDLLTMSTYFICTMLVVTELLKEGIGKEYMLMIKVVKQEIIVFLWHCYFWY